MTTYATPTPTTDFPFYLLAALFGAAAGAVDVAIDDLLFTALIVLSACMLLGWLRPRRAWRWAAVVGMFIPLAELAAFFAMKIKPSRGQIYGSFLTALPGIAGAYGGSEMRRLLNHLRAGN